MGLVVALLLLALPVAEVIVFASVAGSIGIGNAIGLLILVSLAGISLARRIGLGALDRLRRAQIDGTPPSRELTDSGLMLLGAFLLVLPGFITDVVGLALLLPPVRALVRRFVLPRLGKSRRIVLVGQSARYGNSDVWDVESWEEPTKSRPESQIGDGS